MSQKPSDQELINLLQEASGRIVQLHGVLLDEAGLSLNIPNSNKLLNQINAAVKALTPAATDDGETYTPPPLTETQLALLVDFAKQHGRAWKQVLNDMWRKAETSGELHNLRNTHGPTWLFDRFKLPKSAPHVA